MLIFFSVWLAWIWLTSINWLDKAFKVSVHNKWMSHRSVTIFKAQHTSRFRTIDLYSLIIVTVFLVLFKLIFSSIAVQTPSAKTSLTFLKSNFYFRFHSPLNGKSVLLNFTSTWHLVLICWKMWSSKPENCRNQIPHTSKIGKLLPVCLSNNTCVFWYTWYLTCVQNLTILASTSITNMLQHWNTNYLCLKECTDLAC